MNHIKFTDLNKINPNKDKKKKANPFSKLEEKLESKLMDKFGSITNVTNRRSSRYKNTLNSSTDASSYLNSSMNSIDHNSHRSNSEDKSKRDKIDLNPVLPDINNLNVNSMNMTSSSSDGNSNLNKYGFKQKQKQLFKSQDIKDVALPSERKKAVQPYSRRSKYDKVDNMYNTTQGGANTGNNVNTGTPNTNNINNLQVYNIKLDQSANAKDMQLEEKLIDNKNKAKTLITQTMKTDDNFNESLKFIRTIPKIELFDRPKKTIPPRD